MSIQTPDVTITGTLTDMSGNPLIGGVRFVLCNYGSTIPRIAGSNELAKLEIVTSSNQYGVWSAALYRNNVIVPPNTYYQVQIGVPTSPNWTWDEATLLQTIILNTPGTFDLSNLPAATPPSPNPPATLIVVPPATPSQPGGVKLPPSDTYQDYTLSTVAITGNYNDLIDIPASIYDVAWFWPNQYTSTQTLLYQPIERTVTFPANMTGSAAAVGTNPTNAVVFTLNKNGASIGTLTYSTSGVGTFSTTATTFNAGDVFSIVAPSLTDTTGSNYGATFTGSF